MNDSLADASMHSVFRTLVGVATTADVIMQFYVIFLVFRVASATLKEYRYFMLLCSVWDVTFAGWVGYFLRLRPLTPKAPCAVVEGVLSIFGHDGARFALPLMYFFGTTLIGSQVYCVEYRVVLVLDNQRIKPWLISIQYVALVAVSITVSSAAVAIGMYKTGVPTVYRLDGSAYWPDAVDSSFTDTNVLYRAALLTDVDSAVFCVRVDSLSLRVSLAVIMLFAAVEIGSVAAGVWIIRKVKKHASYSAKTKEMHLQLTRLLIAQMLCPCVFMVVPAFFYGSILIIGNWVETVAYHIILFLICLFPLANALLAVYFVGPYRRFTLQLLCFFMRNSDGQRELDFSSGFASDAARVRVSPTPCGRGDAVARGGHQSLCPITELISKDACVLSKVTPRSRADVTAFTQ